jgi:hypothetical protein
MSDIWDTVLLSSLLLIISLFGVLTLNRFYPRKNMGRFKISPFSTPKHSRVIKFVVYLLAILIIAAWLYYAYYVKVIAAL